MPSDKPSRILIVRTDRLGDLIMTLPMARTLKLSNPETRVLFAVREYTRPIAERCPDIDEVIVISDSPTFLQLIRQFFRSRASAVFFPNARFVAAAAAWFARIPIRVGTAFRWYSMLYNRRIKDHRKTAEYNEAAYNLRMLRSSLRVTTDRDLLPRLLLGEPEMSNVAVWRSSCGIGDKPYVVLHIGTNGSTQEWPTEHFVALGEWLARDLALPIVLTGLESDRTKLASVKKAIGMEHNIHFFLNKPLPELASLLSQSALVVSNATGPGHLAAALGAPTIGLFPLPKPISIARWGFRGKRAINIAPPPKADCPNCQSCDCMERLAVENVRLQAEQLLRNLGPATE